MLANLFFILLVALIGGLVAKLLKIPSLVGYILAGFVGGLIFSFDVSVSENIAELGVILLLFSVGLEISLEKLMRVGRVVLIGAVLQIIIVSAILFWLFVTLGNISPSSALVLALSFAMSSTALIVKMLQDTNEVETIHSEILMGWALVQDLAVIPIVVLLPTLALQNTSWSNVALSSILTTGLILGIVFVTGKLIAPYLTHLVATTNNHELLVLLAITLALGIASMVGLFGISSAFGAFLAGVVISKTQENHAIFSETKPIRDILSILFFVTLGFLVSPSFVVGHFFTILAITIFVILIKILVTFLLCQFFGYKGKTAVAVSFGLAQVGEFAFVLFLISTKLGILSNDLAQIGIATTLFSLLVSPFLFKESNSVWKLLKELTKDSPFKKFFVPGVSREEELAVMQNHIIIAGYGRMGKWIGKALKEIGVDFLIVDYNHRVVKDARHVGLNAIYGDASFPEILDTAGIEKAKAILITVPDINSQEEIIIYCQKNFPAVKIMARAHLDSDIKKLFGFKLEKVVQPEFEAALSVVRSILVNSGRGKEEVNKKIKSLRLSHANI